VGREIETFLGTHINIFLVSSQIFWAINLCVFFPIIFGCNNMMYAKANGILVAGNGFGRERQ
jgi:hypothetical protein